MGGDEKLLAFVAVDPLSEADAVALVREHQPRHGSADDGPGFPTPTEEVAALDLVRALGGFTLAVEQVAIYLGLHPEIAPSAFLSGLRTRGLDSIDRLVGSREVASQILHREKHLGLVLEATLASLDGPCRTALACAAALAPDHVPWPWLKALTIKLHPQLAEHAPDERDPWVTVRRRLLGLRLLKEGDHPEVARIHRLVSSHVRQQGDAAVDEHVRDHLTDRIWALHDAPHDRAEDWELDALGLAVPGILADGRYAAEQLRRLASAGAGLAETGRISAAHKRGFNRGRSLS